MKFKSQHFILLTLLVPNISLAADLCRQVLRASISAEARDATLDALADMKLQLDQEKAQGAQTALHKQTRTQFTAKKQELQNELNLSEKEIAKLIGEKIAQKQNEKTQGSKEESKVRQQQESVLRDIPHFKKIKSHKISNLDNGVLSPDGQVLHLFVSNPNKIVSVNLETGSEKVTQYDSRLDLKDNLVLRIQDQWYGFDLDSSTVTPLNTSMTDSTFRKLRVSIDKKTIVDFSSELQNPADETLNVEFRDSHALILKHREIPFKLPVTDIPYVSDHYMLIASGERLFKYEIQSENLIELNGVKSGIISPVEGTNKVVIREDAHAFVLLDLDNNATVRRQFDKIAQVFYAQGDRIMIHERDRTALAHFHLINTSDFTKSTEGLPDRTNFFVQDIPGTEYVTVHNEHITSTEKPGIYHKDDLLSPVFAFENTNNMNDNSKVHRQWVSRDGKRIISTIFVPREMPIVEIWEKQN